MADKLAALKGVQFNPPPAGPIMDAAMNFANEAVSKLPPGASGGIFSIVTTKGVNAVVVQKVNDNFKVAGFIGKTWGKPVELGASAVMTW